MTQMQHSPLSTLFFAILLTQFSGCLDEPSPTSCAQDPSLPECAAQDVGPEEDRSPPIDSEPGPDLAQSDAQPADGAVFVDAEQRRDGLVGDAAQADDMTIIDADVVSCPPNWWDRNSGVEDGCEAFCEPDPRGPMERVDFRDNDCDGVTDEAADGPGQDNEEFRVAIGNNHSCAIFPSWTGADAGRIKCWGVNSNGETGRNWKEPAAPGLERVGDAADEMGENLPFVDLGTDPQSGEPYRVLQLALGAYHSCALLDTPDRGVKCWGADGSGQTGLELEWNDVCEPGEPAVPCAIGDGPGEMGDNLPFVDLGADVQPVGIVAGSYYTCVLNFDGRVKCWGRDNGAGVLGLGEAGNRGDNPGEMGDNLPFVDLGEPAVSIVTAGFSTCALLTGGRIKCWGSNQYGQLGQDHDGVSVGTRPEEMGEFLPEVRLPAMRDGLAWIPVAMTGASAGTVCATMVVADGGRPAQILCWGANFFGLLGQERAAPAFDESELREGHVGLAQMPVAEATPVDLGSSCGIGDAQDGLDVVALSMGTHHACAHLTGGRLKCWGRNNTYQLGLEDLDEVRGDEPVDLNGDGQADREMGNRLPCVDLGVSEQGAPVRVQALSANTGGGHTCASLDGGRLRCWGWNGRGQLGLGRVPDRYRPGADLPPTILRGCTVDEQCGDERICDAPTSSCVQAD